MQINVPRPVISRRQWAIHVVARPFDLLLWCDVLMNAHHLLSSRAEASTIPLHSLQPLRSQSGHRHMASGRTGTTITNMPSRSQQATRPHRFRGPVLWSAHPGGLPVAQDPPRRIGLAAQSAKSALIWLLSFRGLGLLGLRLPGERCHGSALQLPAIPAQAPPFD